ncbi:hypothetical protein RCL1_004055 [Eukaryota sp. TZLM3-RCL]
MQVLDFKNFIPGRGILPNSFFILEQLPGLVHVEDMTPFLMSKGNWPSYNIPYNKVIYKTAGYPELVEQYGDQFDFDKCPRAKIFAREIPLINDYTSFKRVMRLNDYKNDPYSLGSAKNAIAARNDVDPVNPRAFGAIDCKITKFGSHFNLWMDHISGPTITPDLPPFEWSDKYTDAREGVPLKFNFDWQISTHNRICPL